MCHGDWWRQKQGQGQLFFRSYGQSWQEQFFPAAEDQYPEEEEETGLLKDKEDGGDKGCQTKDVDDEEAVVFILLGKEAPGMSLFRSELWDMGHLSVIGDPVLVHWSVDVCSTSLYRPTCAGDVFFLLQEGSC